MNRIRKNRKNKSSKSISPFAFPNVDDENFDVQRRTYDVKVSKTIGRYMVARNHIQPGQIIVKERPLVVGPCVGGKVQCLGCHKDLEENKQWLRCVGCRWPICSSSCNDLGAPFGHSSHECSVLKACNSGDFLNENDLDECALNYHAIVPLRCLLLKTTNPSAFETLMNMESHNEIRRSIPEVWSRNQATVVDRIRKKWNLLEYEEEEIHTICGILEVNAFEIGHQGINARGVYPTAFLMSHDCVPNTNHSDESDSYELTVRASVHIPKHHPITLSYAHTLQGTLRRREHLLENKFFECYCARCNDPTELGTHLSSLICPKCHIGVMVSEDALKPEASFVCQSRKNCPGYVLSAQSHKLLIERMNEEYEKIDSNDVKSLEEFLHKYRNVLHTNHYICLGATLSLSQLYGRIEGYLIHQLSDQLLGRKIEICEMILKIFDVIEPGLTKLRGVTLYELHAPLMVLLTRQFERGVLSREEIRIKLKKVLNCLLEARNILRLEPAVSAEGLMGLAAEEALSQLKDWEKIIGKL